MKQAERPMILRIHHAQITIPSAAQDAARDFYCRVLGLPEIAKPASLQDRGGFWLRIADQDLHVGMEDGMDRTETKAHLAYQVTDLAFWRTHLEAHGCATLDGIPIPGYARFETRDPFGNRLEFIQTLSEQT